jgi:hypothetical protein
MLLSLEDPTFPQEAWTVVPVYARPSTTKAGYFKVLKDEVIWLPDYVPADRLKPVTTASDKSKNPKGRVNVGVAGETVVSVVGIPHLGGTRKPPK